jgi:hypothetical protein
LNPVVRGRQALVRVACVSPMLRRDPPQCATTRSGSVERISDNFNAKRYAGLAYALRRGNL